MLSFFLFSSDKKQLCERSCPKVSALGRPSASRLYSRRRPERAGDIDLQDNDQILGSERVQENNRQLAAQHGQLLLQVGVFEYKRNECHRHRVRI
jgi:hypothetical protein